MRFVTLGIALSLVAATLAQNTAPASYKLSWLSWSDGATGDRTWLKLAQSSAAYLDLNFRSSSGAGYLTAVSNTDHSYRAHAQRDESALVVRVANLLFWYTGNEDFQKIRDRAMRYLAAEEVASRLPVATALLADFASAHPPLHLTVVGHKDDPSPKALFTARLQFPATYKWLEWWDTRERQTSQSGRAVPFCRKGRRIRMHGKNLLLAHLRSRGDSSQNPQNLELTSKWCFDGRAINVQRKRTTGHVGGERVEVYWYFTF